MLCLLSKCLANLVSVVPSGTPSLRRIFCLSSVALVRCLLFQTTCFHHTLVAVHVAPFYAVYSGEMRPLADFTVIPEELETVALPNGDLVLRMADGVEPSFDVVAVVAGSYLEAPPGFPK